MIVGPGNLAGRFVTPTGGGTPRSLADIARDVSTARSWRGKKWYAIGDSITYRKVYQPIVQAMTGIATVVTDAISGQALHTMADRVDAAALADIDLVTVYCIANNYTITGTPFGTMADTKATASWYGYIKKVIDKIQVAKPSVRLVFIACQRLGTDAYRPTYPGPDSFGKYQGDYVTVLKEVCAHYGVPVIDLYSESGISEFNWATLTDDQIHPNAAGMQRVAGVIAGRLNEL